MQSTDRAVLTERIFAGALVLATGMQIAESLVPRVPIFPWLRLGLSWAILLPFLLSFGTRPAIALFLARNVLSLSYGGQPPSTFLISSLSGVLSLVLTGNVIRWLVDRKWFGWIGASVALAASFNVLQLAAVTAILVGHSGNLFQLGPILAWSAVSGTLVAWLARSFATPTLWDDVDRAVPGHAANLDRTAATTPWVRLAIWSALAIVPFAISDWRLLGIYSGALLLIAYGRRGFAGLRIVRQSWPYFAFLAWLHLLDTPGHFLSSSPVTAEGLRAFALHASRLCAFLLATQELAPLIPWRRLAPTSIWARGMGLALPLLPGLFPVATKAARSWWSKRKEPGRKNLAQTILGGLRSDS
ncbi:MAG: Gx transporter family protein [Fibrobacterota bacterium]